jgi:hypothetical protein
MGLFVDDPKPFAIGQSAIWMCETPNGSAIPITVRVVNVVSDRVVIRIVKQPGGAVYFRAVDLSSLQGASPLRSNGEVMKSSEECCSD